MGKPLTPEQWRLLQVLAAGTVPQAEPFLTLYPSLRRLVRRRLAEVVKGHIRVTEAGRRRAASPPS